MRVACDSSRTVASRRACLRGNSTQRLPERSRSDLLLLLRGEIFRAGSSGSRVSTTNTAPELEALASLRPNVVEPAQEAGWNVVTMAPVTYLPGRLSKKAADGRARLFLRTLQERHSVAALEVRPRLCSRHSHWRFSLRSTTACGTPASMLPIGAR